MSLSAKGSGVRGVLLPDSEAAALSGWPSMLVAWIGQQVEDEAECRSVQDTVMGRSSTKNRKLRRLTALRKLANCDFYLVPGDLQKLLLVFHLRGYCIKE